MATLKAIGAGNRISAFASDDIGRGINDGNTITVALRSTGLIRPEMTQPMTNRLTARRRGIKHLHFAYSARHEKPAVK